MISALSILTYQNHAKDSLMSSGNKNLDRCVFHYLLGAMDLRTGLIGSPHKVSYSRIALDISEKGGKGSRKAPILFTRNDVRNAVERLCSCGLMDRMSKSGRDTNLILRACLENSEKNDADYFVEKKVTQILREVSTPQVPDIVKNIDENKIASYAEVKTNLPSFLPTTSDSHDSSPDLRGNKFAMTLDWMPTMQFQEMVNKSYKPSESLMKKVKAALIDFKMYWSNQNIELTQTDWQSKLFRNDLKPVLIGESATRYSAPTKKSSGNKKSTPLKHLEVPEKLFGIMLQQWGVRNGFRGYNAGENDDMYRGALRVHVAKKNTEGYQKSQTGVTQ